MPLDRTGEPIEPPAVCPYGCRNGWLGITAEDPYPDVMRACPKCRKPEKHVGIHYDPTRLSDDARAAIAAREALDAIERAQREERQ